MKNKKAKYYLFFLKVILSSFLFSQKIASVQLYNPNSTDFSSFIFEKGTPFIFSFDDLEKQPSNYYYTITHHNANWKKSSLFPGEYLKGMQKVYFNQFSTSFNTNNFYRNYQITFPNKNTELLVTGNYTISIYNINNSKKPIIQRKFCLYQNLNPLSLELFRQVNEQNKNQRIQVSFNSKKDFINNLNFLKLYTIQNNNFNSLKEYNSPFFTSDKIIFNANNTVFDGSNEYYFFDTKILNINGFSTYKIEQTDYQTHTYLLPNSIVSNNSNYIFINDLNGGFYFRTLNLLNEFDAKVSADYTFVHFSLLSEEQLVNPVHVLGGFNNWEIKEENKMVYNHENKVYELNLFLKQGYYNYTFSTIKNNFEVDLSEINGSFWQTENNYKSLLYFRPFGERYDQLIGYGELGTFPQK